MKEKRNQGGINMKYRKLILSLVLLIISIVYIIHPYIIDKDTHVDGYKDKVIRFHVKANSDTEEDQALKLKIRDEILKETKTQFEGSESIEDTRTMVEANLNNIKSIAQEVIAREGKDFSVDVSFGQKSFPTRKYGNITFPSGEYETLQVNIGEGQGKNWWCVMFPPLCFVDMGHGNANNIEQDLKETLNEDDVDFLLSDKESSIVLKSKIMEMLEKTKTYFAKN